MNAKSGSAIQERKRLKKENKAYFDILWKDISPLYFQSYLWTKELSLIIFTFHKDIRFS